MRRAILDPPGITRTDPLIRQIVNRHDVRDDYLTVLRHVIAQLDDGYATFVAGMSRAGRHELIRHVFACHREHRTRVAERSSRVTLSSGPAASRA